MIRLFFLGVVLSFCTALPVYSGLPETLEKIKSSIVGVGTYQLTRNPAAKLMGTGFVVGNGHYVITNHHVIPSFIDDNNMERLSVFVGQGKNAKVRSASVVELDGIHDLALLKISGDALSPMRFGQAGKVREGELFAFTGFPIGAVLGLYPVTHRGIISAISPIAIPVISTETLDVKMIKRLRNPFNVFQLDATAYPGNSGSPLYDVQTGDVIGVINKVFIKETKESVLEKPSGITYAIPVNHVINLIKNAGL